MQAWLHRPLTLAEIAAHAGCSVRSLNRRFRFEVATTPLRWLVGARELLESTDWTVERVAVAAGFATAATLRHHFTRVVGTSPRAYREMFGGRGGVGGGK
ncbi:helix-turn-helix domain-containing protein [Salinactinospora qingdaonensis]